MTQPAPASRHTVDSLTDDELTRLYDDLDWAREQTRAAQQETTDAVTRAEKAERAVDHLTDRYRGAEAEVQQWRDTYGEHTLRRTLARLHDAEAALNAVRALHQRQPDADYCDLCSNHGDITWPCPTIAALDAHTNPKDQT